MICKMSYTRFKADLHPSLNHEERVAQNGYKDASANVSRSVPHWGLTADCTTGGTSS